MTTKRRGLTIFSQKAVVFVLILLIGVVGPLVPLAPVVKPILANHDVPPPQELTFSLNFSTTNQSFWGPDNAPPPGTKEAGIFHLTWDKSGSADGIQDFIGGVKFGASASGASSGFFKMSNQFRNISGGEVNVNYPVDVKLTVPAADSFRRGDRVTIGSSWQVQDAAALDIIRPTGALGLNMDFALQSYADASACVFSCSSDTLVDEDWEFGGDIVHHDGSDLTVFGAIPIPNEKVVTAPIGLLTGVNGRFSAPDVALTSSLQPDSRTLKATGSDKFVDMDINLTTWLKHALPKGNLLGVPIPPIVDGVSGIIANFDARVFIKATQSHEVTFTPVIMAHLEFPEPVQYKVRGPKGAIIKSGFAAVVEYAAGNNLEFIVPDSATPGSFFGEIIPSFSLHNKFTTNITTSTTQNLRLDTLKIELNTPGGEVVPGFELIPGGCINYLFGKKCWSAVNVPPVMAPAIDLKLGPVWRHVVPIHTSTNRDMFVPRNHTWQLQGFQTFGGEAYSLKPQYPPAAALNGPDTLNEGSQATFTFAMSDPDSGDSLTYTLDFGDGNQATGVSGAAHQQFTVHHTYADNGNYQARLTVMDHHLNKAVATHPITVNNVAPVLTLAATPGVIDESEVVVVSGFITDPGSKDNFVLTIAWGQGEPTRTYHYPAGRTSFSESHQYRDDGPGPGSASPYDYTIQATLRDKDGGQDSKTAAVTVHNTEPVAFAGTDLVVDEGSLVSLGSDSIFFQNLIVNGDAESGTGGWSAPVNFMVRPYTEPAPPWDGAAPEVILYAGPKASGSWRAFSDPSTCLTGLTYPSGENLPANIRSIHVPEGFVASLHNGCYNTFAFQSFGPGTWELPSGLGSSRLRIEKAVTLVTTSDVNVAPVMGPAPSLGYYNDTIGVKLDGTHVYFPNGRPGLTVYSEPNGVIFPESHDWPGAQGQSHFFEAPESSGSLCMLDHFGDLPEGFDKIRSVRTGAYQVLVHNECPQTSSPTGAVNVHPNRTLNFCDADDLANPNWNCAENFMLAPAAFEVIRDTRRILPLNSLLPIVPDGWVLDSLDKPEYSRPRIDSVDALLGEDWLSASPPCPRTRGGVPIRCPFHSHGRSLRRTPLRM